MFFRNLGVAAPRNSLESDDGITLETSSMSRELKQEGFHDTVSGSCQTVFVTFIFLSFCVIGCMCFSGGNENCSI